LTDELDPREKAAALAWRSPRRSQKRRSRLANAERIGAAQKRKKPEDDKQQHL